MNEFLTKYILNVFIFALLIFALIVFISIIGINLNTEEPPKKLLQVVTIEGLAQIETGANAFCESHRGSSGALNNACGRLTNRNCNETSCCVFTNNKCVAGSARGPTYNANSNGKTNTANFYYQNKCYGATCPQ
jgi:hypothetical protein